MGAAALGEPRVRIERAGAVDIERIGAVGGTAAAIATRTCSWPRAVPWSPASIPGTRVATGHDG